MLIKGGGITRPTHPEFEKTQRPRIVPPPPGGWGVWAASQPPKQYTTHEHWTSFQKFQKFCHIWAIYLVSSLSESHDESEELEPSEEAPSSFEESLDCFLFFTCTLLHICGHLLALPFRLLATAISTCHARPCTRRISALAHMSSATVAKSYSVQGTLSRAKIIHCSTNLVLMCSHWGANRQVS